MLNIQELAPDNPAHLGTYRYETFTYSNGTYKHRPEFGEQTTLKSGSVDASLYIHNWNSWREIFWGFDERQLPLNGRVWMPQRRRAVSARLDRPRQSYDGKIFRRRICLSR